MKEYRPRIVCFSCKFSWGYLTGEDALSSKVDNWVPLICTGKIDATHILDAFRAGADGVLILGCPEGDCHYQDGNYEARKRIYLIRTLLQALGIETERIRMELSADSEGRTIPDLVQEMRKDLAKLGPAKTSLSTEEQPQQAVKARGGK